MDINEKMNLVKLLAEINGQTIINKLEGKDNVELLEKAKKVAKKLSEEGVFEFNFNSDEEFEKSLDNFVNNF